MIITALRKGLGELVIFIDWITRPGKKKRSNEAQADVEESAKGLSLYQFRGCPFCIKTRRTLHKLNVPLTLRDAKNDPQARQDLEQQGGKIQVPCLRIEENGQITWLYESKAIIAYLNERFGSI